MNTLSPARTQAGKQLPFETALPPNILNIEQKRRSNLLPWRGQFSPQLVEALLQAYAPRNGVVLDPFMGIGNTAIACIRLGVNFIGFEIDEEYVRIAERRIEEEKKRIIEEKNIKGIINLSYYER